MCTPAGYRGGIEGFSGRQNRLGRVWGGYIIELSSQWSDGGHVVPLMEEEMSFLARLIVHKRALLLFREAPASPCALALHPFHTISDTHSHTSGLSVKIMEFEVQQIEINAHTQTQTF